MTGVLNLRNILQSSQHLMLGHHRPASETPFKWRFAGGQIMARHPISPNQIKKHFIKFEPPLTKLS